MDGVGGLEKGEEVPGGQYRMDEGTEGSALGGRGGLGVAESSTGVFGVGVPGWGWPCCGVKVSGVCGDRKGAGAVDGIVDYPELEGICEGHGAVESRQILALQGALS